MLRALPQGRVRGPGGPGQGPGRHALRCVGPFGTGRGRQSVQRAKWCCCRCGNSIPWPRPCIWPMPRRRWKPVTGSACWKCPPCRFPSCAGRQGRCRRCARHARAGRKRRGGYGAGRGPAAGSVRKGAPASRRWRTAPARASTVMGIFASFRPGERAHGAFRAGHRAGGCPA